MKSWVWGVIGWLFDMLAGWRGQAAATEAHAEAKADRAEADRKAAELDDPEAEWRSRWNRDGPHIPVLPVVLVLAATLGLASCAAPAPTVVVDTFCDTLPGPITHGDGDHVTKETARQIVAINDLWVNKCGAKAKAKR